MKVFKGWESKLGWERKDHWKCVTSI